IGATLRRVIRRFVSSLRERGHRLAGSTQRFPVALHLLRCGSDVAISFGAVHHRIGFPFRAILLLVSVPAFPRRKVVFFIGRESLNLFLGETRNEGALMLGGIVNLAGRQNKFLCAQPSTGIHYEIIYVSARVIENDIVDLAELFIILT